MMGLAYLLSVLDIALASGFKVIVAGEGEAAHYTPGSGTGLALEDAIALRETLLDETEDRSAPFTAYEESRRPTVTRFTRPGARGAGRR